MAFSLRGVSTPDRKSTASSPAVRMPVPKTVSIPMVMHIGKPAKPVVKVGDHVDVGTLIAEQDGVISSPIYASISGTVTKVTDMLISTGAFVPAITIEADGENTVSADVVPPVINSKEDFIEAIKKSGLVGLGGAGFPTYVKLNSDKLIEHFIINGTECEPYITSDTRTMIDDADYIAKAIEAVDKYLNVGQFIIAVEKNKKEALAKMNEIAAKNSKVSVKLLPARYPQGGEKVLVFNTTKKVIKAGQLPLDVGCIVCNCTTMAFIAKYLETGMPLIEKTITVDGGCVKEPKNVTAPIGVALKEVFDFCGGFNEAPQKVIYGGPMMGVSVPNTDVPVLKQTNAILALNEKEVRAPKQTNCIRCGNCLNTCPLGINPVDIVRYYDLRDMPKLKKAGIEVCMECGCCSYNCPASRPLVQINKMAKIAYKEYKAEQEKEANK